jgi:hypothetical protein
MYIYYIYLCIQKDVLQRPIDLFDEHFRVLETILVEGNSLRAIEGLESNSLHRLLISDEPHLTLTPSSFGSLPSLKV